MYSRTFGFATHEALCLTVECLEHFQKTHPQAVGFLKFFQKNHDKNKELAKLGPVATEAVAVEFFKFLGNGQDPVITTSGSVTTVQVVLGEHVTKNDREVILNSLTRKMISSPSACDRLVSELSEILSTPNPQALTPEQRLRFGQFLTAADGLSLIKKCLKNPKQGLTPEMATFDPGSGTTLFRELCGDMDQFLTTAEKKRLQDKIKDSINNMMGWSAFGLVFLAIALALILCAALLTPPRLCPSYCPRSCIFCPCFS